MSKLAYALFFATFILSCSRDEGSELKLIHGQDNRVAATDMGQLPLAAVGKLLIEVSGGYNVCTATLIAPDKVLTAAHCAFTEQGLLTSRNIQFFRALVGMPADFKSGNRVVRSWRDPQYGKGSPNANRRVDWAVLSLSRPEYAPSLKIDGRGLALNSRISAIGYHTDFFGGWYAGVEQGCRVSKVSPQVPSSFWSSCDVNKGGSGGPVIAWDLEANQFHIVGIIVSEGSSSAGSFHVRSSYFFDMVSRLLI